MDHLRADGSKQGSLNSVHPSRSDDDEVGRARFCSLDDDLRRLTTTFKEDRVETSFDKRRACLAELGAPLRQLVRVDRHRPMNSAGMNGNDADN